MNIPKEHLRIDNEDMRVGKGIGGWDMKMTITHEPTGCSVIVRTKGSEPMSPHNMRAHALAVLELLIEPYLEAKP